MPAKKSKKRGPAKEDTIMLGLRIPVTYRVWLEGRLKDRPPGFLLSDEVRTILKAEKDREEARAR